MMVAGFVMPEKRRITVSDSNEKNLNWNLGSYILVYANQKYCDMLRVEKPSMKN